MRKPIQLMRLSFVLLIVLLSGCAPIFTPILSTSTPSSTAIPEPTTTATPIPSPTEIPLVWKAFPLIDSPFIYYANKGFYYNDEIYGSGIVLDTDTRWIIDVQVGNHGRDVGESSTGIYLQGYTESGNRQTLFLVYQNGFWSIGYQPIDTEANFPYWQTFKNLTVPTQSFELSISRDGKNITLKNGEGFEFHQTVMKLFDEAQVITAGTQTGPRTEITLSKLIVEQLKRPSEPAVSAISLEIA